MELLLLSNGFFEGKTYLEYALGDIQDHFQSAKNPKTLLFVPYAKKDGDAYVKLASEALAPIGVNLISAHTQAQPASMLENVDGVFVAGGNTFRLLDTIQRNGLFDAIRDKVLAGMPYLGVSAGTNLAAPTIKTTNDMPIAWPSTPNAFGFVPFQINPHYISGKFYYDEDGVKVPYNGETRDEKIAEYHQENHLPVLALREGTGLRLADRELELVGTKPARLFVKGQDAVDLGPSVFHSALRPTFEARLSQARPETQPR